MTKVKVFTKVHVSDLDAILKGWLDKVNPVRVLAVSQSEDYADFTVIIFYERLTRQ